MTFDISLVLVIIAILMDSPWWAIFWVVVHSFH